MKWFLILWAGPVTLLGSWYGLSYYDMNFGFRILSRELHDLVFIIYGGILGVPPESVPGLVFNAILVDTVLVAGLVYLRWRRQKLWSLVRSLFSRKTDDQRREDAIESPSSLSSAP